MGNVNYEVQQVIRILKQIGECRDFIMALLIKFVIQPGRLVLNKERNHELVQDKSMGQNAAPIIIEDLMKGKWRSFIN